MYRVLYDQTVTTNKRTSERTTLLSGVQTGTIQHLGDDFQNRDVSLGAASVSALLLYAHSQHPVRLRHLLRREHQPRVEP